MDGPEGTGAADERFGGRPTFLQRRALKDLAKFARNNPDEPLGAEDWEAYFRYGSQPSGRVMKRLLRALPSTPRCGYCGAPFAGLGARFVRPLGYTPSRKNPHICATCVELAPPGGMTIDLGVLFADLRGFTSHSEVLTPAEVGAELRRFYGHAEKTFFPEALIDKLIGDEVMALYIPVLLSDAHLHDVQPTDELNHTTAAVMVGHARELLERIGYGSKQGPEFEVGIGLDFGEAFVGNIGGNAAVHDFTAVGDVVNTAARLQGHAKGGEVILSDRVAQLLDEPVGAPERITVKGKRAKVEIRRVTWFAGTS